MASAQVLPFPLDRRRDLIRRQASWFAEQPHGAAEKNLQHQLRLQRDTLLKKGIDPAMVDAEIERLAGAIRAEVWRMVFEQGGAA